MLNDKDRVVLFTSLVCLYRLLPAVDLFAYDNFRLAEDMRVTKDLVDAVSDVISNGNGLCDVEIQIDYCDIDDFSLDRVGSICTTLNVNFRKANDDKFLGFFDNYSAYVSSFYKQLSAGDSCFGSWFFIDKDEVYDDNEDGCLSRLLGFLPWIKLLESISDISKESDFGKTLYFFRKLDSDKTLKPYSIDISIDPSFLKLPKISGLGDLEDLIIGNDKLHIEEKRSLFKVALVDLIKKLEFEYPGNNKLLLLGENIDRLKSSYLEHYEMFVQDFALSEFHQEVEEKYFDYIEKIQSVISDIQAKVYAMPAVLIGMAALVRFKSIESYLYILLGVFFTCLLTYLMLLDQFSRLDRIKDSMNFVFRKLERMGTEIISRKEVMSDISEMQVKISNLVEAKNNRLKFYVVLCWSIFLIALLSFFVKHGHAVSIILNSAITIGSDSVINFLLGRV